MCCPTDCYEIVSGVRLRPVPEMAACLAYTPAKAALHRPKCGHLDDRQPV